MMNKCHDMPLFCFFLSMGFGGHHDTFSGCLRHFAWSRMPPHICRWFEHVDILGIPKVLKKWAKWLFFHGQDGVAVPWNSNVFGIHIHQKSVFRFTFPWCLCIFRCGSLVEENGRNAPWRWRWPRNMEDVSWPSSLKDPHNLFLTNPTAWFSEWTKITPKMSLSVTFKHDVTTFWLNQWLLCLSPKYEDLWTTSCYSICPGAWRRPPLTSTRWLGALKFRRDPCWMSRLEASNFCWSIVVVF